MSRMLVVVGLLAFLGMAGLGALGQATGQEKAKALSKTQVAPKVQPTQSSQPIRVQNCTIRLKDEAILGSGRTGILSEVPKEGDFIKKGQVVVRIKDDVAQANFNTAEKEASSRVEIMYGEKNRDHEKVGYDAYLEANEKLKDSIPRLEVLKQKLAWERAMLQVDKAEHDFAVNQLKRDEASATLEMFKIEAPFDGVVTKVLRNKGEAVREGDTVVEISGTDLVHVQGAVSITEVWNVKQGADVKVQLDIKNVDLPVEELMFDGKLVFVDVKSDPITHETRVVAEVRNRGNVLRAGLTAKMTIMTGPATQQAALPGN